MHVDKEVLSFEIKTSLVNLLEFCVLENNFSCKEDAECNFCVNQ